MWKSRVNRIQPKCDLLEEENERIQGELQIVNNKNKRLESELRIVSRRVVSNDRVIKKYTIHNMLLYCDETFEVECV